MRNKSAWTKEDEIKHINQIQDEYVNDLIAIMLSELPMHTAMKAISFTSPTGTGKTKMMSKLINKMSDWFFIVTTLSRGQLHKQIEVALKSECVKNNFIIYGAMSFKANSKLTEKKLLSQLPSNKKVCWIRDEGHIATKKWTQTLENRCDKIINLSATNQDDGGIVCNFTNTMMLRTVNQENGSPEDAILKLIEVKRAHKKIHTYNPCAIFRVVNSETAELIEQLCNQYNLKTISLVDNYDYIMSELCEDDNQYDVVINKQKITEGIDIRRAHVLWLENKPNNIATIIQTIGRCRRNALLWRNDVDILDEKNQQLLEDTRQCYVFYNVSDTSVQTDENGELAIAFCPYISVQKLKPGHTIYVQNGQMKNGLYICELLHMSGLFKIEIDQETGFNVVKNDDCYKSQVSVGNTLIDDWFFAISSLKNAPKSYWNNLKKCTDKLIINTGWFIDKEYRMSSDNSSIEQTRYMPHIDKNGNIQSTKQKRSVWDLMLNKTNHLTAQNDEYIEVLEIVQKHKYCFHKTQIDKIGIEINNHIYMITLSELYYLIDQKGFGYAAIDFLHRRVQHEYDIPENERIKLHDTNSAKINDRLLAILGIDTFRQTKNKSGQVIWVPSKAITDRISKTTKLDTYIETLFKEHLNEVQPQLFSFDNDFGFDKRCNSCVGYCVEYYAKYTLYGKSYLGKFLDQANKEFNKSSTVQQQGKKDPKMIAIRACMLKYKQEVADTYGQNASAIVRTLTIEQMINKNMKKFIKLVDSLGKTTAEFIRQNCDVEAAKNSDNRLITKHMIGLMDMNDCNTIVDIKCTNRIDRRMIKQILAYALMSQYRSDLNIQNVIVYDAVSQRHVKIDVSDIIHVDQDVYSLQCNKQQSLWIETDFFYNTRACLWLDKRDFYDHNSYRFFSQSSNNISLISQCFDDIFLPLGAHETVDKYCKKYKKGKREIHFQENLLTNEHVAIIKAVLQIDEKLNMQKAWELFTAKADTITNRLNNHEISTSYYFEPENDNCKWHTTK